jgi:hypothetical protein
MRYAKLGLGVLLVVAGVLVTANGASGVLFYFRDCFGAAPGSLAAEVCHRSSFAREAIEWVIGALILDAAAVVVIRSRAAAWFNRTRIDGPAGRVPEPPTH